MTSQDRVQSLQFTRSLTVVRGADELPIQYSSYDDTHEEQDERDKEQTK